MSNDVNDQDRERPYVIDGIKEFDNPMPRWWVGLFYATIVFSLCYLARIYVFGAPTLQQEFDTAVAATKAKASSGSANRVNQRRQNMRSSISRRINQICAT